ncbi:nitroreductase family protein [Actinosynnema pretiosum subsp. pretiosum]|uniref:Uncharacterized protein n=2 Tax=Actinosynnema TaxID=40566 RepID=C6WMF7_ACTMD|nr:nitroreductase family protein [Actinosynnema mirum]ACU36486.1 conserved hypothetical protein [Actinosynnema mirum DSM 43827]AXX29939.1 Dinucleotide-utilizing enzymes involved in molybdopterin and thiamine biosynthesis family 2 [Actinosynnema pretiosum subsp. pretiosum]QUF05869.1 nitroreductase family protein [Actinosynnema pretiosum subsp. pretiosum]
MALGLTNDEVTAALEAASLAPSVHNTQPWLFRVAEDRIELHADTSRALRATDPEDRELRLSCGAALLNLRVALEGAGVRTTVAVAHGTGSGALAVLRRVGGAAQPEPALVAAIPRRRTNRRPFRADPVPLGFRTALVRAAERERSWLHVVTDREERARLRGMVARAHRELDADPRVQAELRRWTGLRVGADGVPTRAAGPRPAAGDEWATRDFLARGLPERVGAAESGGGDLVAVLCSYHDGPAAEVRAGQAMQRVLLTATSLGLSASFLSQPVEVPAIREEVRLLAGGPFPQTVLRLGFGEPVPPTPRRSVADLLMG